jgi:hypothetical protein
MRFIIISAFFCLLSVAAFPAESLSIELWQAKNNCYTGGGIDETGCAGKNRVCDNFLEPADGIDDQGECEAYCDEKRAEYRARYVGFDCGFVVPIAHRQCERLCRSK